VALVLVGMGATAREGIVAGVAFLLGLALLRLSRRRDRAAPAAARG
jgi:hypothetical protein